MEKSNLLVELQQLNVNDEEELVSKENFPCKDKTNSAFYTDAAAYWDKVPATVDGVLGGFSHISTVDINGSQSFLKEIFQMQDSPGYGRAVDCGAGIGRITKDLLQGHFEKVDLVEQCSQFLDKAKESFINSKKIGEYYCMGLQNFEPAPNLYDVIWCQFVLSHLTNADLESFFRRSIKGLKPNGVIVAKENVSGSGKVELDKVDSSVTRPQSLFLNIMGKAGLKIIKNTKQKNLPRNLYEVRMFCMKPKNI